MKPIEPGSKPIEADQQKPKYLTAEACARLLFGDAMPCPDTWASWRVKGIIPALRINRRFFYDPVAVEAALVAHSLKLAK